MSLTVFLTGMANGHIEVGFNDTKSDIFLKIRAATGFIYFSFDYDVFAQYDTIEVRPCPKQEATLRLCKDLAAGTVHPFPDHVLEDIATADRPHDRWGTATKTPLEVCYENKDIESFKKIAKAESFDPNFHFTNGFSMLWTSTMPGSNTDDFSLFLIEAGADIHETIGGLKLIEKVIRCNNAVVVEGLIRSGIDIRLTCALRIRIINYINDIKVFDVVCKYYTLTDYDLECLVKSPYSKRISEYARDILLKRGVSI